MMGLRPADAGYEKCYDVLISLSSDVLCCCPIPGDDALCPRGVAHISNQASIADCLGGHPR